MEGEVCSHWLSLALCLDTIVDDYGVQRVEKLVVCALWKREERWALFCVIVCVCLK